MSLTRFETNPLQQFCQCGVPSSVEASKYDFLARVPASGARRSPVVTTATVRQSGGMLFRAPRRAHAGRRQAVEHLLTTEEVEALRNVAFNHLQRL